MRKTSIFKLCAMVAAVSCGGQIEGNSLGDNPGSASQAVGTGSALYDNLITIPRPKYNGKDTWDGSTVDLAVADAMAACAPYDPGATEVDNDIPEEQIAATDEYLAQVFTHMKAAAGNVSGADLNNKPLQAWRYMRSTSWYNYFPGNLSSSATVNLNAETSAAISVTQSKPKYAVTSSLISSTSLQSYSFINAVNNSFYTRPIAAARTALARPTTLLCMATQLRKLMPSTAAAGGLTMRGAELRQLLDVMGRLSRQSALGFARLAQLKTVAPLPVSAGLYGQYFNTAQNAWVTGSYLSDEHFPVLMNRQLNINTSTVLNELKEMGDDFATAVDYVRFTAEEELATRRRDAWARSDRGQIFGTSALPSGAAIAPTTLADEFWGRGSWVQRAEASLFGGKDLAVSGANTPWPVSASNAATPGVAIASTTALDWPNAINVSVPDVELPYVSKQVRRPQVGKLDLLARAQRDPVSNLPTALDLTVVSVTPPREPKTATGSPTAQYTKTCYRVKTSDNTNAVSLYKKLEKAQLAVLPSSWINGVPKEPSDPSVAANQTGFELYKKHGITFEDAKEYVEYLADVVGLLCVGEGSAPPTSQLWGSDIKLAYPTLHLGPDTVFADMDVTQRAPAYEKLVTFRLPDEYNLYSDARELGFTMPPASGSAMDAASLALSRQEAALGANAVLTAVRQAVIKASTNAGGFSGITNRGPEILGVVESLIGDEGMVLRPKIDPNVTEPVSVGSPNLKCVTSAGGTFSQTLPNANGSLITVTSNACGLRQASNPTYNAWTLDVLFDATKDPFWMDMQSGGQFTAYAIPMNPYAGMMARDPSKTPSLDLNLTYNGVKYTNISGLLSNFKNTSFGGAPVLSRLVIPNIEASKFDVPGSTSKKGVQVTFDLPENVVSGVTKDSSWTIIIESVKNGVSKYRVLGDGVKFRPSWGNKKAWTATQGGYYFSQSADESHPSTLLAPLAEMMKTDPGNRSLPKTDPFGLRRDYVPQLPPNSVEAGVTDSVEHWLNQASRAADEATQAFREAVDNQIQAQLDQASEQQQAIRSLNSMQNAHRKVCGDNTTCDLGSAQVLLKNDPRVQGLINTTEAAILANPKKAFGANDWVAVCVNSVPSAKIPQGSQDPWTGQYTYSDASYLESSWKLAIDCYARAMLETVASRPLTVAQPVADAYASGVEVASFPDYKGGSLAVLFSNEFAQLQTLRSMMIQLGMTRSKILAQIHGAAWGLNAAYDSINQAYASEHNACEVSVAEGFAAAGALWGGLVSIFTGGSGSLGQGIGAAVGTLDKGNSDSCKAAEHAAEVAQDQAMAASYNALASVYADLESMHGQHTQLVEGYNRLIGTQAEIAAQVSSAQADITTAKMEAMMAGQSSKTSFEAFRIYHSQDFDRVMALLQNARKMAVIARRDIENRYLVDLSTVHADQELVAAPASWADSIYAYDMSAAETIGQGVLVGDSIKINAIQDYVNNLRLFVQGYAGLHPTTVAKNDVSLVNLDGPASSKKLGDHQVPSTDALRWSFHCPAEDSWVQPSYAVAFDQNNGVVTHASLPPYEFDIAALCPMQGGKIQMPDRARIGFNLRESGSDKIFNLRWDDLAINLMGTAIVDCDSSSEVFDCHTNRFVLANLTHSGPAYAAGYDGDGHMINLPTAFVQHAKALATEKVLDTIGTNFSDPSVSSVTRGDLINRPLAGNYELELVLTPDVHLERLLRVQILVRSHHWEKQLAPGQQ